MRGSARQDLHPRGGAPPEGEIGGAGRPGSRPRATTCHPVWARRTPCSARLRRPLDAWPAWPPCRAGYRRPASPQSAPPCPRACVEGTGGTGARPLAPKPSPCRDAGARGLTPEPPDRRSAGLAAMPVKVSDCDPRLLRWGAALQVSRHPISEADALCHAASAPSRTVYI